MIPRRDRLLLAGALSVVLLATAVAYLPSIDGEFQLDDWMSVEANWNLRDLGRVAAGFSPVELLGPDRPVTGLSFALDYAIGGLKKRAYHVSSLIVHLAAVLLAFAFVRRLLQRAGHARALPVAVAVAALFALHPLQTQAVSYVTQRAEALSAAFYLAALLLFQRAWDAWPRRGAAAWALGATAVTLLALGAKTVAVTVPAAFLLWAVVLGREGGGLPLARRAGRALLLASGAWAMAAASIARSLLRLQPDSGVGFGNRTIGAWEYLLTQLRVHWLYARLLVWPAGQTIDHQVAPSPAIPDLATVAAGLATLALVAGAVLLVRRAERGGDGAPAARAAAFGIGWWYLILSPTSSFIPIVDLTFEHRAYLASLGLLLALVVALERFASTRGDPRRALTLAAAACVVACATLGGATAARADAWSTRIGLWEDEVAKRPESYRSAANLAHALATAGRLDESIRWFVRAQELAPGVPQRTHVAWNLSQAYAATRRFELALAVAEEGIAEAPSQWQLRMARANALRSLTRYDEALDEAERAVRMAPNIPHPHDVLGIILLSKRRPADALEQFRRAREIEPGERVFTEHLVLAFDALGQRAEACAAWTAAQGLVGTTDPVARATARRLGCGR